uniref:Oleosin n=1 Tax=Kalanchoe fedtschenkoi TaxID=63787 RepID=A0A7N0T5F3_KALFE
MGDRGHAHQLQVHTTQHHPQYADKSRFTATGQHDKAAQGGPSTTKVLTVMGLLPVGGTFLTLAGLLFAGTMAGLAVTFPLFVLFSPVLVPAALAIGLAVAGILTSGAFGLTAISSLSWVLSYLRGTVPGQIHQAKRGMQDMTEYVGVKTKEVGETIQSKAQEAKRGDTAATARNTTTTTTA